MFQTLSMSLNAKITGTESGERITATQGALEEGIYLCNESTKASSLNDNKKAEIFLQRS